MKLFILIFLIKCSSSEIYRFPDDFLFGAATGKSHVTFDENLKFKTS